MLPCSSAWIFFISFWLGCENVSYGWLEPLYNCIYYIFGCAARAANARFPTQPTTTYVARGRVRAFFRIGWGNYYLLRSSKRAQRGDILPLMRARFALLGVIATASTVYATALDVVGVVSAYFRSYVDLLMCVCAHFLFYLFF